jgi:hypothetical protein
MTCVIFARIVPTFAATFSICGVFALSAAGARTFGLTEKTQGVFVKETDFEHFPA